MNVVKKSRITIMVATFVAIMCLLILLLPSEVYGQDYDIGDTGPAGGIIIFVDGNVRMEVAPSDQSTGVQWYNGSYITIGTGLTGTFIGSGDDNTQAIVRLSTSDEQLILRALETGCRGIMVPHITTAEDAKKVAQACKYAPEGTRGLSPYTRNHEFTHDDLTISLANENNNTFVGILVEGQKGISNLEEISNVEGIDLIYTGIYDISQSIGLTGQLTHPDVLELQKNVFQ